MQQYKDTFPIHASVSLQYYSVIAHIINYCSRTNIILHTFASTFNILRGTNSGIIERQHLDMFYMKYYTAMLYI
jgi:hypothetical protein